MLLLLDDAADEAQVEPLLPADPGCTTIVTSRSALAGLDADRMWLAPVDVPDAKVIVAAFAGRRPPPDGAALDRIVTACAACRWRSGSPAPSWPRRRNCPQPSSAGCSPAAGRFGWPRER